MSSDGRAATPGAQLVGNASQQIVDKSKMPSIRRNAADIRPGASFDDEVRPLNAILSRA